MKVIKLFYVTLCTSIFLFSSCKKNESKDDSGNVVVEGPISLTVHAIHHTWGVSYINVYLKKNANTFPGYDTTKYDLRIQADPDGFVTFEHLFPGNYYLYASGYDYFFGAPVKGYNPVVLNTSTAPDNKATVTLYTSE